MLCILNKRLAVVFIIYHDEKNDGGIHELKKISQKKMSGIRIFVLFLHKMKQIVNIQYCHFPCGNMVLASVGDELCLCDWAGKACAERNIRRLKRLLNADIVEQSSDVIQQTMAQLDEYFAGQRKTFDIKLHVVGTEFQRKVWAALLEIPYGETRSYKDIALRVNNLKGVRAVAQAIGANGIAVIIPCHRVIGADKSLVGFAGGLDAKRMLLHVEGL